MSLGRGVPSVQKRDWASDSRGQTCPSASIKQAPQRRLPGLDQIYQDYLDDVTRECVMAWTESAIRFCTPTLRMSLATWAFTVRSSMPSTEPISLLDRPTTRSSSTSFSRSVKVTLPAGKMRSGHEVNPSHKNYRH